MIIILAGYDADMNKLMSVNTGLSSRFPEEIIFKHMAPEHCLQLLAGDLKKKSITCPALDDQSSSDYATMRTLIEKLASIPGWGNARDVKTLAKTMVGTVFKSTNRSRSLSSDDALRLTRTMLKEKTERAEHLPAVPSTRASPRPAALPPARTDQPPSFSTSTATKSAPAKQAEKAETAGLPPTPPADDGRDAGVSDAIWNQLQADKRAAEEKKRLAEEAQREQERLAEEKRLAIKAAEEAQAALARAIAKAKEEAELAELRRRQEAARLAEQRARIARERAQAERERLRREEEARVRTEAKAQEKLRQMGVCCAGFQWIKQHSGYRCAGGSHFVSDSQLGM